MASPSQLKVGDRSYAIHRLDELQATYDIARLPYTLRVLLENVLRNGDEADVEAVARWNAKAEPSEEISFAPSRVLLQDLTGVPAVVDLAAMRNAMADLGGEPSKINPLIPAELVIDHSVQVDSFASRMAFGQNVELEFERNHERYLFLRWGQKAFSGFQVVPPGTGICHQVNLEYLARVVEDRDGAAFPDTLVGTDSHTTMVNGLGVLGWGVGGIEAEAAMLGQPLSMLVPQVVGFKLSGALPDGATATDLVLTVTEMLRKTGVVGKFVEYFGEGLTSLPLADRATIGNMSPEYGATCGFFPVDNVTLDYLRLTGRSPERIALVEAYCKENMLWHDPSEHATYSRDRRARPRRRRAVARRPAPAAGPRAAREREGGVPRDARDVRRRPAQRLARQGGRRHLPGLRPDDRAAARRRARAGARQRAGRHRVGPRAPAHSRRGRRLRARPRLRRDRRDHLVHEHVEPAGDGRGRTARAERRRAGAAAPAVGQVVARPGLEGRHALLRAGRAAGAPRHARLQHRRLRLHDVHRQLRPARRRDRRPRSARATSSSARCSRATATSRRASIPR